MTNFVCVSNSNLVHSLLRPHLEAFQNRTKIDDLHMTNWDNSDVVVCVELMSLISCHLCLQKMHFESIVVNFVDQRHLCNFLCV